MNYNRNQLEAEIGKTLPNSKVFEQSTDAFKAINDAKNFCREQGFSVGTMQADAPMGIKRGNYNIEKWRNLDSKDRRRMDGAILGSDKRHGPVTVVWCDKED